MKRAVNVKSSVECQTYTFLSIVARLDSRLILFSFLLSQPLQLAHETLEQ